MDPQLPLFPLPEDSDPPPARDPELAVASPASTRPVWLHGERASVLGTVRGAYDEIRLDGRNVVADFTVAAGIVANAVTSPGLLRRERVSPLGSAQETLVVAPTLPLVFLAVEGPEGAAAIELTALPGAPSPSFRTEGGTVTIGGVEPGAVLAVASRPPSARWTVEAAGAGGLRLRCQAPGGVRALAVAYGDQGAVRAALSATRHLAGHARRATAVPEGTLSLRSGVAALDDAVAWMQRRLSAGIGLAAASRGTNPAPPAGGSEAWLWAGLGAASVGDATSAASCIGALDRSGRDDAALLLAGRLALLTGRSTGLVDRATAITTLLGGPEADTPARPLAALALGVAADALRHAAPTDVIEQLRAAGRAVDTSVATEGGEARRSAGRRLPTLGGRAAPVGPGGSAGRASAAAVSHLLDGAAGAEGARRRARAHPAAGDLERALDAWGRLVSGDAEGWPAWRALVAAGLEDDAPGVAAWDPFDAGRPPAVTGALLAGLAHGWLGARPDAPVGRLRLAPRVPAHVTGYRFERIDVGDQRVTLTYEREGATHRFVLTPESGRVPPIVVFEPLVPEPAVGGVRIDGEPAEVDTRPGPSGTTVVSLQTPVDGPRRIEIHGA